MNFIDYIKKNLIESYNQSVTENGAVGYRTTGKALLDINFALSSLRNKSDEEVLKCYARAFFDNKLLAIKWLFFAGDVRGGLGERRLFRLGLLFLSQCQPELTKKLLPLVPEYTRWDNILVLLDTQLRGDVCLLISEQLKCDLENMANGQHVSLCAKWMPSINASSKNNVRLAKLIVEYMGVTAKEYRIMLAKLRAYIDVVETKMSAKKWEQINYSTVPSRANLIYNSAFLRNDEKRRKEYLEKLQTGEVKINASALFPHDIVHKYTNAAHWQSTLTDVDQTLEGLWKALPDYVNGQENTICVSDGSGSMYTRVGNSKVTCLDVAIALSIYFAEKSSGQFKDKYITFSENPQLVDFSHCTTLRDKIGVALAYSEVANTNIERVFDLILQTAIDGKMTQDELPKNILILSDMEFDSCAVSTNHGASFEYYDSYKSKINAKLFEVIEQKYAAHGYKLPRLVFWNICSRTGTIPVRENALGVALVSGFSPTIANMVLSNKIDPFECLLEQLNKERYQAVEEVIKSVINN